MFWEQSQIHRPKEAIAAIWMLFPRQEHLVVTPFVFKSADPPSNRVWLRSTVEAVGISERVS